MNGLSVARTPQPRRASHDHRPSDLSRLPDDRAAEAIAKIADALARDRETLLAAVDLVNRSTFEEVRRNRRRARALVFEVWRNLAVAARALAEPIPPFRPDATGYRPHARRHQVDIADFQSVALPARLLEVAR